MAALVTLFLCPLLTELLSLKHPKDVGGHKADTCHATTFSHSSKPLASLPSLLNSHLLLPCYE